MNKFIYIIFIFFIFSLYSCKDNRTDYQKASDYFKNKKYERAIIYFKKSIKAGIKDNSILYKKLATSYINIGRLREGENYIRKALVLSPDDDTLGILYSQILLKRREYYKATYRLKKLPNSFDKYYQLANVYFLAHNIKVAFSNLNKALTFLDTDEKKVKEKYKFALKLLTQEEICIEKNKIFNELTPPLQNDINFLKNYYTALNCHYKNTLDNRSIIKRYNETKKQRDKTRYKTLTKLIKQIPNKFYYNQLAQLSIDKRDFTNARKYINESKFQETNQNILLFLEAQIDFYEERYESVISKLEKYLKKENNVKALSFLAKAEYLNGNNYSAIKHYKELLTQDPYNKDHLYKLEELYSLVNDKKSLTDIKYKIKFFYRKFYK